MKTNPSNPENRALFAPRARLETGWRANVLLEWNRHGTLTSVRGDVAPETLKQIPHLERTPGPILAGMPNLHSHAFQSAMAGLTQYRAQATDSFWSWRELMYRFAQRVSPEGIAAIARWLYIDMLKAGYTSVCEFHYVHHQRSEEHTSELQSLMRTSYAVFCLKK